MVELRLASATIDTEKSKEESCMMKKMLQDSLTLYFTFWQHHPLPTVLGLEQGAERELVVRRSRGDAGSRCNGHTCPNTALAPDTTSQGLSESTHTHFSLYLPSLLSASSSLLLSPLFPSLLSFLRQQLDHYETGFDTN